MDPAKLIRYFELTPRTYLRLFFAVVGGLLVLLLALRQVVWPDLDPRLVSIPVLGATGLLLSYRFVLPFAYAWRLRSRRGFITLLAVWLYVMAWLGLAAGSGLDYRLLGPLLLTVPVACGILIVVTMTALPADVVRAQWALRNGQTATARAYLDRAVSRHRFSTEMLLLRANVEFHEQRPADAIAIYRQAAAWDPCNAAVYTGMGTVHYAEGEFREAVPAFRRALELQPGVGLHHYNLGLALRLVQEHREALDHLRRAIELGLRPEFGAFAYYASGRILETLKPGSNVARYDQRATELATPQTLEFWQGVFRKSNLIHRVDVRRFLSIVVPPAPEPPPGLDDDMM